MYTALWWKDARQFWPIWVFLALAAAVVQGLLLYYLGQDARHGALGVSALICASLYAFATGAAAFAGEREMGTLRLLDILPADRRVVWAAKVSFALVTTLALVLILLALAAAYTDRWKPEGTLLVWEALGVAMIVLIALGWGLFWSAILSNALTAAVTAIFCTAVSLGILTSRLDEVFLGHRDLSLFVFCQFFLFLATLVASVAIFARTMRWKWLQLEFRSPIVVNLADSTGPRRPQLQIQSPVAAVLAPRPAVGIGDASATDQPPRRSWIVEARAMAWQTMKEGRKTWGLLAAIGLLASALIYLDFGHLDLSWLGLIGIGSSLVAGASVFGLENRAQTQRFLTHHGARPGLVWMVKLAIWTIGMLMIWGPMSILAVVVQTYATAHPVVVRSSFEWLAVIPIMMFYLSIGLLCGMAIRRGITAVVIAVVTSLALTIPLLSLVAASMLPIQGLLIVPAGLLAVSWAWRGDWMLDRPAPGRWIRLGLLLTGLSTLSVSAYASYRAWSIRDVGPIAPPAVWIEMAAAPLPPDQNAADLYREAGRRMIGPFEDSPKFLDRNRELLDLLRRAAARPNCRFLEPEKLTAIDRSDLPPLSQLALLLTLDASERQNHGDLAGAWDDIMVLFRMAHHVGEGTGFAFAFPETLSVERNALGQALEWAVARGQTPERLHAALAAYRDLPKMAPTADIVRAEANVIEKTLDLPAARLRDWVFESANPGPGAKTALTAALFDLPTTPWERVRARRVNRLVANAVLQDTTREPWQRSRVPNLEIEHAQTTTRNAMMLIRSLTNPVMTFDQNEVARRALVQVLALRAWQLQHGGQFPKSLDELVPAELSSLPRDPYSGKPFGYIPTHGLDIPALHLVLTPFGKGHHAPTPGGWLLYSVGPNGHDDGGFTYIKNSISPQPLDLVFEIPPVESDGGAGKGKEGTPR